MTTGIDEQQLHDLLGRIVIDFGAVSNAPLVLIGDRLGLYRALGAQAGEARTRAVVTGAGFTHFRRATQTPFNLVYEARP